MDERCRALMPPSQEDDDHHHDGGDDGGDHRNHHRVILVPWIPATFDTSTSASMGIVVEGAVEEACALGLLAQTKASPGWWTGVTKLTFQPEQHRDEEGGDDDDDATSTTTKLTTCMIPELFNEEIHDYWKQLKEVVVEPGVRILGNSFLSSSNMSNLTSVSLPEGLESIGGNFCFESSLTTFTLPSTVRNIGSSFLFSCNHLVQVDLFGGREEGGGQSPPHPSPPSSLTSVGDAFLFRCRKLESVALPDSLTSVDDFFLSGCDELREVAFPSALTSMGDYLFEECLKLRKVEFLLSSQTATSQLTAIGHNFCNNCPNLELVLNIPDSVTSIGKYFCEGSGEMLKTLTLPDALASIADGPKFLESVAGPGELQVPSHLLPQALDGDPLIAAVAAADSSAEVSPDLRLRVTLVEVAAKRGWNLVPKNAEQK